MISRRSWIGAGLALVAAAALPAGTGRADEPALARFAEGGRVLLMRHALAPGVGDPQGFRLDDCATQRNLNDAGRGQARRLGERLRAVGLTGAKVLSSRWCRARETAELLGLGPVEAFQPIDSVFGVPGERQPSTERLRAYLASLPRDGAPVIMVTHQVNITNLTGIFPESGEALILRLDGTGAPAVEARVTTGF
jgi:phosphohistidine phosphatase SixA